MKPLSAILTALRHIKPRLYHRYGIQRMALFGSYARGDQEENSDVDILVDVDPSVGLNYVSMAEEIENAIGLTTDVVSFRALKPRYKALIEGELIDV